MNNFIKLSDQTLDAWSRIMQLDPESRLLLKINGIESEYLKHEVNARLREFDIPTERIQMIGKQKNNPYHFYNEIDVCLDPFPYNGCTTSFDSLWMGVPFITLTGNRSLARVGISILSNIGLEELIAETPRQYIDIALKLSASPDYLANIRNNLRNRMLNSPLTDASMLTQNLEKAYQEMWEIWLNKNS